MVRWVTKERDKSTATLVRPQGISRNFSLALGMEVARWATTGRSAAPLVFGVAPRICLVADTERIVHEHDRGTRFFGSAFVQGRLEDLLPNANTIILQILAHSVTTSPADHIQGAGRKHNRSVEERLHHLGSTGWAVALGSMPSVGSHVVRPGRLTGKEVVLPSGRATDVAKRQPKETASPDEIIVNE